VKRLLTTCLSLALCGVAAAQSGDVLGVHDLSSSTANVKGANSAACLYCHAPHSGISKGPLWSQTLSTQTYTLYTSDTLSNTTVQPALGAASSLCLSCHDGTIAPGQTVPYGTITVTGTMTNLFNSKLNTSHPFSLKLPLQDSADLVPSLVASQTTADTTKKVNLINGNVECTSCHEPHNQRIDPRSPYFLVMDNAKSTICLACHQTSPRTVNSSQNPLALWTTSVHATSGAQVAVSSGLGGYNTVAEFGCSTCHVGHNAGNAAGLLRNPVPPAANVDTTSQSCITCHNGSNNLLQPLTDVFGEFQKRGHPYTSTGNAHLASEPVVLVLNRHTTCVDCHEAHSSAPTTTFGPAPAIRPSQNGTTGVAADGTLISGAVANQYENCYRCHGSGSGQQVLSSYGYLPTRGAYAGDPLNLIPQFNTSALSAHPVARDALGSNQPSLLSAMWDLTGKTPLRPMGTRIFCTDCHNSDDNREFGGTGPNGPHGSKNDHILERQYLASQVNPGVWPTGGPGTLINNLAPTPLLDPVASPYALCAKCHNLSNIMTNVTFPQHSRHLNAGISCSVCHTAHGVPSGSTGVTGQHLVNFDVNVVTGYKGTISYSATGTCVLTCHMMDHNPNGTVSPAH